MLAGFTIIGLQASPWFLRQRELSGSVIMNFRKQEARDFHSIYPAFTEIFFSLSLLFWTKSTVMLLKY